MVRVKASGSIVKPEGLKYKGKILVNDVIKMLCDNLFQSYISLSILIMKRKVRRTTRMGRGWLHRPARPRPVIVEMTEIGVSDLGDDDPVGALKKRNQ